MEKISVSDGEVHVLVEQLRAEHAALDARLRELEHHISLTPEEEYEIHMLKKRKLATKDRIAMITSRGGGTA